MTSFFLYCQLLFVITSMILFQDVLQIILKSFDSISYEIFHIYEYSSKKTIVSEPSCVNYIIFCQDPEITATKFGHTIDSRVFIVTIGSKWQIQEFFKSQASQNIMNLLIASAGPAFLVPSIFYPAREHANPAHLATIETVFTIRIRRQVRVKGGKGARSRGPLILWAHLYLKSILYVFNVFNT
ncbi:unnamed protein product [Aphis gossypii]|uniref:Uncharacterized protein n=1 Tax=Aphis gossypii TaxID=80765 RepID=A0A9P0JJ90_APHGO|nr:unnamed protein product [Aphis gossypii]